MLSEDIVCQPSDALNLSRSARPPIIDKDWILFDPLHQLLELPGQNVAFMVCPGWDADPIRSVDIPGKTSIVQPRGLRPQEHLRAALLAAQGEHPMGKPPRINEGSIDQSNFCPIAT